MHPIRLFHTVAQASESEWIEVSDEDDEDEDEDGDDSENEESGSEDDSEKSDDEDGDVEVFSLVNKIMRKHAIFTSIFLHKKPCALCFCL